MTTKKAKVGAAKTQTYREAAAQLSRIASELEHGETDLDKLLPLLSEAQNAYEVCRERLDALRGVLGPSAAETALVSERPLPGQASELTDDDF